MLPKMLWTERVISYLPIDKNVFWQQMVARFGVLFAVWLTGLGAYALDNLLPSYVFNVNLYLMLFGTSFIIFFGSYMVPRSLDDLVQKIRPMLQLDDRHFQQLSERLEQYTYSFLPCFLIALGFVVVLGSLTDFQHTLTEGFQIHAVWTLSVTFFMYLMVATGIWMFVSIWITIFLISRQPLNVTLSAETLDNFRALSMVALWFSLFYFLAISIGNASLLVGDPASSLLDIAVSPYLFFIAIGIIGILFPFYNIHVALRKLKEQELSKIAEESEMLLQQLDVALTTSPPNQSDRTIALLARLFSLQVKEKRVQIAQEWPIDVSFISKLVVMGLIPIISRVIAMLLIA